MNNEKSGVIERPVVSDSSDFDMKRLELRKDATLSELRTAVAKAIRGPRLLERWDEKCDEIEQHGVAPFSMTVALAAEFGFAVVPMAKREEAKKLRPFYALVEKLFGKK